MRGNLKALGLAVLAVFAMSAFAASAAQATNGQFKADAYPAVIKGAQEGSPTSNFFEATPENRTTCTTATYQATLPGPNASSELTVTPHYDGCEAAGQPTHIKLNGCDFRFKTAGTTVEGATPGTADVVCPTGQKIEIGVTFLGATICAVHIGPQNGLTGITFTNKGGDTVTVDVNIQNQITYTETDSSFLCPFEKTETYSNGDFVSSVTMTGSKDLGSEPHATTSGVTTYKAGEATNVEVG